MVKSPLMQYETLGVLPRSVIKSNTKFYLRMTAVVEKIEQYQRMVNPSDEPPRKMKMFVASNKAPEQVKKGKTPTTQLNKCQKVSTKATLEIIDHPLAHQLLTITNQLS